MTRTPRLLAAAGVAVGSAALAWALRNELTQSVSLWLAALAIALIALLLRPASKHDHAALQALRNANERALESARIKAEFLATMSHEIRTPLNGVAASAQLLAGTNLSQEQQEHVDIIQTSSEALLAIIDDILDISKIDAGRLELERAPFELVRVLDDVLDILAERIRSKGLEFAYDIDPALPRRLVGDSTRVRQVVLNLVANAVKFTERGEVTISAQCVERDISTHGVERDISTHGVERDISTHGVERDINMRGIERNSSARGIDRERGGVLLEIAVRDSGIGIEPHRLTRLFAPFVQADSSTTRRFGGTGLGLAICKRLVTHMGGTIDVQSSPGHGSQFVFTIRCGIDTTYVPGLPAPDLTGRRILLVHPNEAVRAVMTSWGRRWGMHVEACTSTGAAIKQLAGSAPFDAIVFGTGTHDTASDTFVLQRAAKIPVIVVADRHRRTIGARSEAIAAELIKPVKPAVLEQALAAAFGLAQTAPATHGLLAGNRTWTAASVGDSQPHVLVVEDLEINQHLARKLLERLGCVVDIAADGRSALALTARVRYDLIFMDVQMPDMDGMAVTRAIRAGAGPCQDAPIVAMTANALQQHRYACFAAGMNDYLTKPLASDLLQSMIVRYALRARGDQSADGTAHADSPQGTSPLGDGSRRAHEPVAQAASSIPIDSTAINSTAIVSNAVAYTAVDSAPIVSAAIVSTDAGKQLPVLDPQRVQVLADLARLRLDAFGPVITLYIRTVSARLAALREAIDARDLAALGAAAHAIKGSALNVGANRVVALARALEHAAADDDEQAFSGDCEAIARAFEESVQALRDSADNVARAAIAAVPDHP